MTSQKTIWGKEHQVIDSSNFREKYGAWLVAQKTNHKNEKTLGLYERRGYAPGNFIGMVWIGEGENKAVLRVDSKFPTMDYIKMYADCVTDPVIGERMHCLHFWAEKELIDVTDDKDFLLLTAIAYLRELNTLCMRHLRRHFLREQQNFIGKVKGKILIGENLRQNIIRHRPDRIFCEYQSVSDDVLENRILRAALERVSRYISQYIAQHKKEKKEGKNNLSMPQQWIRACRAHLNGVSIAQIKRRDFTAVRKRGVFAHYARPLHLAKAVLFQLGFNPHKDITQTKTPPFAINSERLFERYAELKLRQKYKDRQLFALYNRSDDVRGGVEGNGSFAVSVRPDFYIPYQEGSSGLPQIIDAKYKPTIVNNEAPAQDDIYQVVAYSQHRELLSKMNCAQDKPIELSLVYPSLDTTKKDITELKATTAFTHKLHVYEILCPTKE